MRIHVLLIALAAGCLDERAPAFDDRARPSGGSQVITEQEAMSGDEAPITDELIEDRIHAIEQGLPVDAQVSVAPAAVAPLCLSLPSCQGFATHWVTLADQRQQSPTGSFLHTIVGGMFRSFDNAFCDWWHVTARYDVKPGDTTVPSGAWVQGILGLTGTSVGPKTTVRPNSTASWVSYSSSPGSDAGTTYFAVGCASRWTHEIYQGNFFAPAPYPRLGASYSHTMCCSI